MTRTRAKTPAAPRTYTQAEVDALKEAASAAARAEQREHDARGEQQTARSAILLAGRGGAKGEPSNDVPLWLKVTGAIAGLVLASGGILAMVWTLAITPITTRLVALETGRGENATAIASLATRAQAVENKQGQFEAQWSTASRIRDQQQQAVTDRLRGLELSDQAGTQQVNALATSLAGLVARMEEMLRRQERLENRLSARPGAEDGPIRLIPRAHPLHIGT